MLSYQKNFSRLIKNCRYFQSTDDIYKRILNNEDKDYYHNMYCDFLKYKPSTLKYLPVCMTSEKSIKCVVSSDGTNLKYFSRSDINELSKLAVLQNGLALKFVPNKLRDLNLCITAVKQNGLSLEFVPKNLVTLELCHSAVANKGSSLEFVPKKYFSNQLFMKALDNDPWALRYIPDSFKTYDIYFEIVKKNVNTICLVPYNYRTKEMCYYAVSFNGCLLSEVPKEIHSDELYKIVYEYYYKNTKF